MAILSEARCRRRAIVSNGATISSKIKSVQENLQEYLQASKPKPTRGRWPPYWLVPYDPVRKKNLQKIDGYLVRMLHLKLDPDPNASDSNISVQPLTSLLQQIKTPETLSSDAVWELADALELELVELGDDTDLYTLLKDLQENDDQWDKYFSRGNLSDPLKIYNGTFPDVERPKIRSFLTSLLRARVSEYRRDRAKAQLRGNYLVFMALFLAVFVSGFTIFFVAAASQAARHQPVDPLFILLLVLFAGAAGSILSRAIKLGKQPLHAERGTKADEVPLGIRALIADRKTFLAQPVIGATTALILFLVFQAGLIQIGGVKELTPAVYGLVGFLGGFSEPFVFGILDKVAGQWGSTLS